MNITAQEILNIQSAYRRENSERMANRPAGVSRAAWKEQNPTTAKPFTANCVDVSTGEDRFMHFDGDKNTLWVWESGDRADIIEHIDITADDADDRLSKYTEVA
jgi:hypothetical protein